MTKQPLRIPTSGPHDALSRRARLQRKVEEHCNHSARAATGLRAALLSPLTAQAGRRSSYEVLLQRYFLSANVRRRYPGGMCGRAQT